MRFVHQQDEVRTRGEVVEIALAQVFGEPLDPGRGPAAHLSVDLRDVEDVDLAADQLVEERAGAGLVVVAGDDLRRLGGEGGDAFEDVLGRAGGEVGDELVVDRQVWGHDEEVVDAVGEVQVADEGAHQARLADARRQGEAEGREIALEIGDARVFGPEHVERGLNIARLLRRRDLRDPVQDLQGLPLRRAQAEPAGDGVDLPVHQASSPKSRCCPSRGGTAGRFSTIRL